jgi:hypothetical protein
MYPIQTPGATILSYQSAPECALALYEIGVWKFTACRDAMRESRSLNAERSGMRRLLNDQFD